MTGKMTDERDLAKEWPEVFDNLLVWGTNIYILEDKAAYGGVAAGYKAPPSAIGRFHFEYCPRQEHWQGGYPGMVPITAQSLEPIHIVGSLLTDVFYAYGKNGSMSETRSY